MSSHGQTHVPSLMHCTRGLDGSCRACTVPRSHGPSVVVGKLCTRSDSSLSLIFTGHLRGSVAPRRSCVFTLSAPRQGDAADFLELVRLDLDGEVAQAEAVVQHAVQLGQDLVDSNSRLSRERKVRNDRSPSR